MLLHLAEKVDVFVASTEHHFEEVPPARLVIQIASLLHLLHRYREERDGSLLLGWLLFEIVYYATVQFHKSLAEDWLFTQTRSIPLYYTTPTHTAIRLRSFKRGLFDGLHFSH